MRVTWYGTATIGIDDGKNKEYHERSKRSETTMFLTEASHRGETKLKYILEICLNSSVGRARGC